MSKYSDPFEKGEVMKIKKIFSLIIGVVMLFMAVLPVGSLADELLKTNKTTYTEGEDILITAVGDGEDWVGIYQKGDPLKDVVSIRWYYVAMDGNTSGSEKNIFHSEYVNRTELASLPAGEYTVYLLADGGYQVLSRVDITVIEDTTVPTVPEAPSEVTYDRTGTYAGAADGKLTIRAGEESLPDSYIAYWGNANGKLDGYTSFAPIECRGQLTEYEMVANTLIPTEADRILVYSARRNKISETAATVMLPEGCNVYDFGTPLYEMQVVSDIHINSSQNHLHNQHFAAALADIRKMSPDSIGLFVNGDIADHGQVAEYKAFQKLVRDAGSPKVYCAIGNHDLAGGPYNSQVANFTQYTEPCTDKAYADAWINGVHFIFLGSEAVGLNADLSRVQLKWLEKTLAENRDENRPIYVFLHQGMMDTVAGTFEYQKWHGVNQEKQLAKILKDYPEVVLFSGHSHWELDSISSMKERDENLPTIFNTASCAYLWNDAAMVTNAGIEGSQGYYIKAYPDMLLVLGRDFVNGQWIASAQFVVQLPQKQQGPETDPDHPAVTTESTNTTEPITTTAPSTNTNQGAGDRSPNLGGILLGVAVAVVAVVGIGAAVMVRKKKK